MSHLETVKKEEKKDVATIEERADRDAAGSCQVSLSRTFQVYHSTPKSVFLYTSVSPVLRECPAWEQPRFPGHLLQPGTLTFPMRATVLVSPGYPWGILAPSGWGKPWDHSWLREGSTQDLGKERRGEGEKKIPSSGSSIEPADKPGFTMNPASAVCLMGCPGSWECHLCLGGGTFSCIVSLPWRLVFLSLLIIMGRLFLPAFLEMGLRASSGLNPFL